MNIHSEETHRNKRQSVSEAVILRKGHANSAFQFADNRTGICTQATNQNIASNGRIVEQASQLQMIASSRSALDKPPLQLVSSGGVIQRVVNGFGLKIRVTPQLTGLVEGGDHDGEAVQLGRLRNRVSIGDLLTATVVDGKVTEGTNDTHQERQRQEQIAANFRQQVQNWLSDNAHSVPLVLIGRRVRVHTRSRGNDVDWEIRDLLPFGEVNHIETVSPTIFKFTMAIPRNRVNQYVNGPDHGDWTIVGELNFEVEGKLLKVWHHGPGG